MRVATGRSLLLLPVGSVRRGTVRPGTLIGWVVSSSRARIGGIVRGSGDSVGGLARILVAVLRRAGVGRSGLCIRAIHRRKDQDAIEYVPGGAVAARFLGLRRAGHDDRQRQREGRSSRSLNRYGAPNEYIVRFHNLTRFSDPRSTQPARRLLRRRFSGLGLNIEIACCGFGAVYEKSIYSNKPSTRGILYTGIKSY